MLDPHVERLVRIAASMIIGAGIIVLLIVAKEILLPMVVAGILAYATLALSSEIKKNIWFGSQQVPTWFAHGLSILMLLAVLYIIWMIIGMHVSALVARIPFYESQLLQLISGVNPNISMYVSSILTKINIGGLVGDIIGSVVNIGSHIVLVIIYTVFIVIEFPFIKKKINYLFQGHAPEKKQTQDVLSYITRDVNAYFRIKTFASLITALLFYIVLLSFNIDFPLFWALIAFLLNFIPTVGSMFAVIFPSLLALIQFASFTSFTVVFLLLIAIQLFIDNVVEPRIASRILNISPLVILGALVVAGALWGFIGMIISVPLVIFIKIIYYNRK